MLKLITFLFSSATLLAALPLSAQEIIVNVKRQTESLIPVDQPVQEYDLNSFFQSYPSPGPVATFTYSMATPDGFRSLLTQKQFDDLGNFTGYTTPRNLMTYLMQSEQKYNNIFVLADNSTELTADDLVIKSDSLTVQLLPQDAPVTVANFISKVRAGHYNELIFQRSTQDNENVGFTRILQAGGYTLYDGEKTGGLPILSPVPRGNTVPMEYSAVNAAGTLAVARPSGLADGGSSEFFFNVSDNTNAYRPGVFFSDPFGYAVFGRLTNPAVDLPKLVELNQIPIYSAARFFGTDALSALPLFIPRSSEVFNPTNYAVIQSINVTEGSPVTGFTFTQEFVDWANNDPGDRQSFEVSLSNGILAIQRKAIGQARILVKATPPTGNVIELSFVLEAYNPDLLSYFSGLTINPIYPELASWYTSPWFGWLMTEFPSEGGSYDTFPWIWHAEHGWIWLSGRGAGNVVFYDASLGWVHTTPTAYPNLYVFDRPGWLYYARGTGAGYQGGKENDLRWFWDFSSTAADKWIQGKDLSTSEE